MTEKQQQNVEELIARVESLTELLENCRDSIKANDYGEDAVGMTAYEQGLVKEIDIVLANGAVSCHSDDSTKTTATADHQ